MGSSHQLAAALLVAVLAALTDAAHAAACAASSEDGAQQGAGSASDARASDASKPATHASDADETPADPDPEAPSYAETLVVTASRAEQQLLDAPVSITVIGPAQLETSPADNYGDLLRGVPGLNVVQTSARDINVTARSPGSTLATSQLALVDGRSIYQDFFGFVMWDSLPVNLDEVKQIEVQRGPGSAMWGANALSGVINVRTKTPRELAGGLVTAGGGEWGTRSASARWADAFARGSYKVSASWFEQDPWPRRNTFANGTPIPADNEFANEGTDQPKVDLRFDWEPVPGRRWSYKAGRAGTTGLLHSGIGPFAMNDSAYMDYGEVAWTSPRVDAKVYVNRIDGDATNLLNYLDFAFQTDTWVADVAASKIQGEKQLWVFGGTARYNSFDLSLAPSESARVEVGVFVEDQIAPSERVLISAGMRIDHFDTIGWALSPRTSLVLKPRKKHSVRFAFNRAYRAPSLINNYLDTVIPNQAELAPPPARPFVFLTFATGQRDLREETVDAFEVGYTGMFRWRTTLTAAVYRNTTRDNIDFHPAVYYSTADPPFAWAFGPVPDRLLVKEYSYRNIGRVVDHGVELSVNRSFGSHFGLTGSYTWQADPKVSGQPTNAALLVTNLPPRNQASVSLHATFPRWRGSASVSYQDRAFWTDVLDERFHAWTDSFLMANASVTWKAGEHVEIVATGTNLLNERIKQHAFGDEIRRKLGAELRWKF